MIVVNNLVSIEDGLNSLETLEDIHWFCLCELMEHHANPEMILLIMDLAGTERKKVQSELRSDLVRLRQRSSSPEFPLPPTCSLSAV